MPDDLSRSDVERVAALARLTLTEDETTLYLRQLTRILDYARQVAELDTRNVPPTASVVGDIPELRPDEIRPSLDHRAALANAPDAASGFFRVPRVLGDA